MIIGNVDYVESI